MSTDAVSAVAEGINNAVSQTDSVAVDILQGAANETVNSDAVSQASVKIVDLAAENLDTGIILISQVAQEIADTVAAKSGFIFDLARVSAPINGNEYINGWIITVFGMSVVAMCLTVITTVITILPKLLAILNKYFPEKTEKAPSVKESSSSPVEAVAAAVAVAYHNYNNNGK
jgi:Na+-transporting methylmalonyl-CoA/oxaloacetate decarboxylase gamma subunit